MLCVKHWSWNYIYNGFFYSNEKGKKGKEEREKEKGMTVRMNGGRYSTK